MKLRIGHITPLVFAPVKADPSAAVLRFTQRFGRYDHIVVQFTIDQAKTAYVGWYNAITGTYIANVTATRINMGGGVWIYSATLPVLPEGMYLVKIGVGSDRWESQAFEVTRSVEDDAEWCRIEYGGTSNDTPMDAAFIVGGVRVPFILRLPAGFKPNGWEGAVATETYRTQRQELRALYSAPYERWTLTIGDASGLPVEYVRLLNNILSCEYVYINGVRYCRSEGSVPEKQLVMQGAQMFTASVTLERQPSLDDYPLEVYQNGDEFNDDYNNDYDI